LRPAGQRDKVVAGHLALEAVVFHLLRTPFYLLLTPRLPGDAASLYQCIDAIVTTTAVTTIDSVAGQA
jgi:hypothetical protein